MATLAAQTTQVTGTTLTSINPTATTGDLIPVGAHVIVNNASGASITVTINKPGNDNYGDARTNHQTSVAAGAMAKFGPFPIDLQDPVNNPGYVTLICSSTASVTLRVVAF